MRCLLSEAFPAGLFLLCRGGVASFQNSKTKTIRVGSVPDGTIYGPYRVFRIASMWCFSAGASDTAVFQTICQLTEK